MMTTAIFNRATIAWRRFSANHAGSVAIEYVVIGAVIGVAVAAAIAVVSGKLTEVFGQVAALFGM